MHPTTVVTGSRVFLSDNTDAIFATIVVDNSSGKVVEIHPEQPDAARYPDAEWIDAGDHIVMPGIVDAHVHLNEPGRTDWEGFYTGTRAAASGGVTTVVDMPLNSIPPTTTVENLEEKRKAANGQCWTDVGFWGGVIPGNQGDLKPLIEAGVKGFKCFLIESGVDEFPCVSEDDLKLAMEELQNTPTVLQFHAELETHHAHSPPLPEPAPANPTLYSTFLNSRPPSLELSAISLITRLLASYPSLRAHIVHLSAADAIPLIKDAKAKGLKLTVETCFHYLAFTSQSIPDGHPEFKCCPPIRTAENREALWAALEDGTIDFVVSDHSPCVAELKKLGPEPGTGDIMGAWGGISTLGLGMSVLWTELQKRTSAGQGENSANVRKLIRWLSTMTAKHASLDGRKGRIAVGSDGDLVIWDPNAEVEVTKTSLNFKNKLSPYEGLHLHGKVEKTILRGRVVYDTDRAGVDKFENGPGPVGTLL
ncbi:allantoinase [Punctularia strigosozonata HHB-11173 SS5]|uniref:allantoinase n=1 Tax=Punctularia strigosozonata (strain HHB-11173) TaxID=741275 RepID=R7S1W5_PUNST|nr:allantoinase [Punctularia strigosozonata HHB-11173 SS5]EIN03757.1 allantoinase [Punctularia strigosozonata HHB-11173 SS5]